MPSGGVTEGVYDFSYRRTVMDRGKDENYFGVTKRSGYSYAMHTSATTSAQGVTEVCDEIPFMHLQVIFQSRIPSLLVFRFKNMAPAICKGV